MKKIVITEAQLEKLIESNKLTDMEEGIFDPIKNAYQGVRGIYKGYGYEFFKYSSELKNILKDLNNINDNIADKYTNKLAELKNKLNSANFSNKDVIEKEILNTEKIIEKFKRRIGGNLSTVKYRLR